MKQAAILYAPFLVGVFAASSGFQSFHLENFLFAALFLTCLHGGVVAYVKSKRLQSYFLLFLSVVFFTILQTLIEHELIFYLLAIILITIVKINSISVSSKRDLFFLIILKIIACSTLTLLGAATQSSTILWGILIIGYVPGCLLAAVDIIKNVSVLEASGWSRSSSLKKGEQEIIRPGSITRLLSIVSVVAPGLVLILVPFNLVPTATLLLGILFYPTLSIVDAFQNESSSDELLATKLMNTAAGSVALMVVIAALSIGLV